MKRFIYCIAVICAVAAAAAAQDKDALRTAEASEPKVRDPKGVAPKERPGKSTPAPNGASGLALAGSSSLQAELQQTIDVRHSQVGDQVLLKTTRAIKQNGETVIPKGTSIVGRITEVQRREKGRGESRIGMLIERVRYDGLSAPITASIVSIIDTREAVSAGDDSGTDVAASTMTVGSASSGGTRQASGGLLGGATSGLGNVVNTAPTATGNVASTAGTAVGSVAGTTSNAAGNVVGSGSGALSGLRISQASSASANGSTLLSSTNKDLKIQKGVTFNLLVNNSFEN